jgi:hypothetical protein
VEHVGGNKLTVAIRMGEKDWTKVGWGILERSCRDLSGRLLMEIEFDRSFWKLKEE